MPYQERVTRNIDLSNVAGVTEYEGNACCYMGCVADWVRLDIDREVDTGKSVEIIVFCRFLNYSVEHFEIIGN